MKKIVLSILFAAFAFAANAQVWVGGSVGFSHSSSDDEHSVTSTKANFAPTIGYKLSEKWDIGLELAYNYANNKDMIYSSIYSDVERKTKQKTFAIEPFVRYNFCKLGIATFFVDGGVGYHYSNNNVDYVFANQNTYHEGAFTSSESKSEYVSVGLRPGVKFGINEHLSLETHLGFLGYSHTCSKIKDNDANPTKTDSFGLNVSGTALNLGIIYEF